MKALLRDTMPRPAFFATFFGIGLVVALLSLICHAPLPLPLPRAPRFAVNMRTRESATGNWRFLRLRAALSPH
jgi:hypothetical protein